MTNPQEQNNHFVIVIDDDKVTIFLTRKCFEVFNKEVKLLAFENALTALEYFKNSENQLPRFLLLDINMPNVSGWEFLEEFATLQLEIPVFMYSSSIDPGDLIRAKEEPLVKGFVSKPLSIDKLTEIYNN